MQAALFDFRKIQIFKSYFSWNGLPLNGIASNLIVAPPQGVTEV